MSETFPFFSMNWSDEGKGIILWSPTFIMIFFFFFFQFWIFTIMLLSAFFYTDTYKVGVYNIIHHLFAISFIFIWFFLAVSVIKCLKYQELFQMEHGVCSNCHLDCHKLVKHIRPLTLDMRRDYIEKVAPNLASRKKLYVFQLIGVLMLVLHRRGRHHYMLSFSCQYISEYVCLW